MLVDDPNFGELHQALPFLTICKPITLAYHSGLSLWPSAQIIHSFHSCPGCELIFTEIVSWTVHLCSAFLFADGTTIVRPGCLLGELWAKTILDKKQKPGQFSLLLWQLSYKLSSC